MNLQAKRAGQLLGVAVLFFLISCEDDSFLLGFKGNSKFKGRIQEFTFSGDASSSFLMDSLITDHYSLTSTQRFLLGKYVDPVLGTVSSTVYTQFQPSIYSRLDDTGLTFDSITLQLRFDFYAYGFTGNSNEKYIVHQITEDTLSLFARYFYNSSFVYDPNPIGEINFDLNYFRLQNNLPKAETARDTILAETTLDLEYGGVLYSYITSNDSLNTDDNNGAFRFRFKGLVFVPVEGNYILGFNPNSGLSQMTLHYHSLQDTLERSFNFLPRYSASFNNIQTIRSNELAGAQPYQKISPANGNRYLQNGSPVISHIDIQSFYDFIKGKDANDPEKDSLEQIIINSAEFSIGAEAPPDGMPPPSSLVMRMMKKTSETELKFVDYLIDSDSIKMMKQRVVVDAGRYFNIADETSSSLSPVIATLTYNASRQAYVGNISLFFQNIFDKKNEEDIDQYYIALMPVNPTMGKSVNRVVLKSDQMKLRIHYIKPN